MQKVNFAVSSCDKQMVYQDYNEVTQAGAAKALSTKPLSSSSKDRPHSSGPSGRRGTVIKASSISSHQFTDTMCVPIAASPISLVTFQSNC